MADRFSIDDIIAEYTEKKKKWVQQHDEEDNQIVSAEDTADGNTSVNSEPETEVTVKPVIEEAVQPVINNDFGAGTDNTEELALREEKAKENAELIGSLTKLRREHGKVEEELSPEPIKPTDINEIDIGE